MIAMPIRPGSRSALLAGMVALSLAGSARTTFVNGTSHGRDLLSPHWNRQAETADRLAARLRGASASPLWGPLDPGPHPVGFRRLTVADPTGTLLVDFWYPAGSRGRPLRFGEYLALADDLRGAIPGSAVGTLAATVTGDSAGIGPALANRILEYPMVAAREAPAAPGPFPLVLWTPRYGTTVAQAVLSEYLASHGFSVAFARRLTPPKLPFELADRPAKLAELEARVGDMVAAIRHLERIPTVETSSIATLAWSYTGEMATALQLREPRVGLVVGLSTNLLANWVFQPADRAAALDSTRLTAAYALIGESGATGPSRPPALERVAGARYAVGLPGLAHGNFNLLEGYLPSLFDIPTVQRWSSSGPRGVEGYRDAAIMTLRLLRHHLAGRVREPMADLVLRSGFRPGATVVP